MQTSHLSKHSLCKSHQWIGGLVLQHNIQCRRNSRFQFFMMPPEVDGRAPTVRVNALILHCCSPPKLFFTQTATANNKAESSVWVMSADECARRGGVGFGCVLRIDPHTLTLATARLPYLLRQQDSILSYCNYLVWFGLFM